METADKTEWTAEAIVEAAVQRVFAAWSESKTALPFEVSLRDVGANTVRQVAAAAQVSSSVLDEALTGIETVARLEGSLDPKDQTVRALQWENKVLRDRLERVRAALGDE